MARNLARSTETYQEECPLRSTTVAIMWKSPEVPLHIYNYQTCSWRSDNWEHHLQKCSVPKKIAAVHGQDPSQLTSRPCAPALKAIIHLDPTTTVDSHILSSMHCFLESFKLVGTNFSFNRTRFPKFRQSCSITLEAASTLSASPQSSVPAAAIIMLLQTETRPEDFSTGSK